MSDAGAAAAGFAASYGSPPTGVWQAPGRVTLIGEHTDYNAGLALTFAIDRRTVVAARTRSDGRIRCQSTADVAPSPDRRMDELAPGTSTGWAAYPHGVLWALARAGVGGGGLDLFVDSSVPVGGGLSSSAALEVAVGLAVTDLAGGGPSGRDLAAVCQEAENAYVGVPSGPMDGLTVALATAGHVLSLDFRSGTTAHRPLAVGPLVVVDTGVRHRNDDGTYADRRRTCEEAAAVLGVTSLREVGPDDLQRLPVKLRARARHVVTEDARVEAARDVLDEPQALGALLSASHRSLRDDFAVSWPEAELVVGAARDAGATGARMVGAGLGGCCLVLGADAGVLAGAVGDAFSRHRIGAEPRVITVTPAAGASRLT